MLELHATRQIIARSRDELKQMHSQAYVRVCVCVRVWQRVQPLENVVQMEDVHCRAKDVMELTTVETIQTKLAAVC